MRYGIISDLHGNHETLERALSALKQRAVDRIVCLGDVLGKSGDNLKCLDLLFAAQVEIVQGNHDRLGKKHLPPIYQEQFVKSLKPVLREHNLVFSHTTTCADARYGRGVWKDDRISTPEHAAAQFKGEPFWVFFFGHTHAAIVCSNETERPTLEAVQAPAVFTLSRERRYLCNPGPLTGRKDIDIESPGRKSATTGIPSFVIFDTDAATLEFVRT